MSKCHVNCWPKTEQKNLLLKNTTYTLTKKLSATPFVPSSCVTSSENVYLNNGQKFDVYNYLLGVMTFLKILECYLKF